MPGPAKKQLCSPLAVWAGGGKKGGSVEFCIAASLGCYVEPWRVLLDAVREEQELVPGGDIRLSGNAWLRSAWDDSQITRVCREAEVRKVIYQLANLYDVCFLVRVSCSPCCFSVQGPCATEAKVDREGHTGHLARLARWMPKLRRRSFVWFSVELVDCSLPRTVDEAETLPMIEELPEGEMQPRGA